MLNRIDELIKRIKENDADRVLLQVPEGLKVKMSEVQERLANYGIDAILSLDVCYGACDILDHEAEMMDCDLLVHLGHSEFIESDVDVVYFPWYYDVDPENLLMKNLELLKEHDTIGLISSINFKRTMERAVDVLEEQGKEVILGSGKNVERGQILGCNITAATDIIEDVDCFVYIGSGKFHPLGVGTVTDKPLYVLDFEKSEMYEPDFDKFERQRIVAMEKARDCKNYGVVISTKKGQNNIEGALEVKRKLEERGNDARLFSMDHISPDKFMGIDVDCLINTACPRIAVENRTDFDVPFLNLDEFYDVFEE